MNLKRLGLVVWYKDEQGERKRKSFSGTTKQEVGKKITAYIESFNGIHAELLDKKGIVHLLNLVNNPAYVHIENTNIEDVISVLSDS